MTQLQLRSNMDDLKRRLESMIGEPPAAPQDRTRKRQVQQEADELRQRQQRVADAGSQVISAVCQLVGALIPSAAPAPDDTSCVKCAEDSSRSFVTMTRGVHNSN